jgi:hypothetical protein
MERTAVTIKGEKILREMYTMDECKAMLEANSMGVARLVGIAEKGLRRVGRRRTLPKQGLEASKTA